MALELTSRPKLRVPTAALDAVLLDQHGRPIGPSRLRHRVADANPRGMETYSSHPEIGLTVESLLSYHRQAEDGSPTRMMDMFDGLIERHADLRGMLNDRNEDVAGADWSIMPPPGRADKPSMMAAQALQESLQSNAGFLQYIEHQLTAIPFGYACTNMVWDMVEKLVVPVQFEPVAQRRFGAPGRDRSDEIWLIDAKESRFDLVELDPGLWSVTRYHHRNPFAAGLMRSCSWWVLFALTGFKQWQVFADMFGLPLAIGYYEEGAGAVSRDAVEDAARSIGQDGYAVLSSMTELVIKETARGGDSTTVYPQIMKVCDAMITKLITGGTLNTDVGGGVGSYNAATVHESRSYKMKRRDAKRLQDSFTESIGKTFVAWNGFDRAAPPVLKMKIARDELARAQTLEIIGQAIEIDQDQIREEFNVREPSPGRGVKFAALESAPPDPNKAKEKR